MTTPLLLSLLIALPPDSCAPLAGSPLVHSTVWGLRNLPPWLASDRSPDVASTEGAILLDRRGQPGETRRWFVRRSNLSLGPEGGVTRVGIAEGTVARTLVEEVEVGLWEEEIRWERYAYGEADDPLAETPLREVPEVVGLTYRRGPGTLGVPADRLAAAAPDVAGPMLQALALDVATWRSPVETLREALGPRVDPGDWTCRPPDEAALEDLDAEATGLTYQLGESLVAAVGWTVVDGERAALLWFAFEGNRVRQALDLGPDLFSLAGTEYFRGFVALSVEDGRPLAGSLTGPLVSRTRIGPAGTEGQDLPMSGILQEVSFREVR